MKRALLLGSAALLAAAGTPRAAYLDGPPPGYTGGFGEPTCRACHFNPDPAAPAGGVRVSGLPAAGYAPGARYLLRVTVRRPGLRAAGFELAARLSDGTQAGTLRAPGAIVRLTEHRGVHFAHHSREGTAAADSAAWTVEWTAPERAAGPVQIHVVSNAANGDGSPLGDHVYQDSASVRPRP